MSLTTYSWLVQYINRRFLISGFLINGFYCIFFQNTGTIFYSHKSFINCITDLFISINTLAYLFCVLNYDVVVKAVERAMKVKGTYIQSKTLRALIIY